MRTIIVAPTYQEAENIEEFLRRVRVAIPSADVLIVDDDSPDGTARIADQIGAELLQIDILRRAAKEGLGDAYRAGFSRALELGYSRIVQMDTDLSHDPRAIPRLLRALDDGADLAIGSRYVSGGTIPEWSIFRRALSRYGNAYARLLLRLHVHDVTSGFRAYRAETLRCIDYASTRAKGYGFLIETVYRVSRRGGRVAEVPITFTDRVGGKSKVSLRIFAEELRLVTWWGFRDRLAARRRGTDDRSLRFDETDTGI